MTNHYERCFLDAANRGITFADEFAPGDGDDDDDEPTLRNAVLSFRSSLRDMPVPISAVQDTDEHVIPGDDDSECAAKASKYVNGLRKKLISFTAIDFGSDRTWLPGGAAHAALQRSRFLESKGEPGKDNSVMMLQAELFPSDSLFQDPNSHKNPVRVSPGIKAAAKWCISAKKDNTVALFGNGRDRKMRRVFESLVDEAVSDEQKHLEINFVYGMPPKGDVRFPKRKTFGALQNAESISAILPVPKVRMSSRRREHFSACGETTTFATSYTCVPVRRMGSVPRLTVSDKEGIVGTTLPAHPEEVVSAVGNKGHPLFWGEIKEVDTYIALFQDLNAESVFDVTPGSGAAAMAAATLNIQYEGLAMNSNHANWLTRILDKTMYAIIMDSSDKDSKTIKADLSQYFSQHIQEARVYLTSADHCEDEESTEGDDGGANE
jgi:hypothetical protein